MKRPWMPFYVGDYLGKTAHLSTEQHGAYILLILHCWQHGVIPIDDDAKLREITKLSKYIFQKYKKNLLNFFNEDGSHSRVNEELEKAELVSLKRKFAGSRGGFHSAIAKAKSKQMPKQTPKQNPSNRSDNHKEDKKEASRKEIPISPELTALVAAKGWNH